MSYLSKLRSLRGLPPLARPTVAPSWNHHAALAPIGKSEPAAPQPKKARPAWLSPEDNKVKEAFDKYDLDKNGTIEFKELQAVLGVVYGDDVPDAIVAEAADGLLAQFDANGDGKISFPEMLSIWGSVRSKQLLAVFNEYDINGDGSISAEELYVVLRELLVDVDMDFVIDLAAEVIVRADGDDDNSISFEEFVKAVDAGLIKVDGVEMSEEAKAAQMAAWLTPAETAMLEEFKQYDLNGDGAISYAELVAILGAVYGDAVPADVIHQAAGDVIDSFDIDGDGEVTFAEILTVWSGVRQQQMRTVFDQYDLDGDGEIQADELYTVLKAILGTDDEDWVIDVTAEVIARADGDGDNAISFDEFVQAVEAGVLKLEDPENVDGGDGDGGGGDGDGGGGGGGGAKPWLSRQDDDVKVAFEAFDINKDGTVEYGELVEALVSIFGADVERAVCEEVATEYMAKYDKDGDGELSLAEMLSVSGSVRAKQLLTVFNEYDINGDGSITIDELYTVLGNLLGFDDNDTLVELASEVIIRADGDDDNSISFDEFVKAVDAGLIKVEGVDPSPEEEAEAEAAAERAAWLSPAEEVMLEEFQAFDLNGDGTISYSELVKMLDAVYQGSVSNAVVVEAAADVIDAFDVDGDGTISFGEVLSVFGSVKKAQMRNVFDEYDLDGDGSISADELYIVLKELLVDYDMDTVVDLTAEVIIRADGDNDDRISFDEFINAVDAGLLKLQGADGEEDSTAPTSIGELVEDAVGDAIETEAIVAEAIAAGEEEDAAAAAADDAAAPTPVAATDGAAAEPFDPKIEEWGRQVFAQFDTDKDGGLSPKELTQALKSLPRKKPKNAAPGTRFQSVDELIAAMDEDGDGKIDVDEWLSRLGSCAGLAAALAENVNADGEIAKFSETSAADEAAGETSAAEEQVEAAAPEEDAAAAAADDAAPAAAAEEAAAEAPPAAEEDAAAAAADDAAPAAAAEEAAAEAPPAAEEDTEAAAAEEAAAEAAPAAEDADATAADDAAPAAAAEDAAAEAAPAAEDADATAVAGSSD